MTYSKIIRALYDYEAQAEDELSFVEGDILAILEEREDDEWYSACLISAPETVALCPKTYVEECEALESCKACYNYESQDETELSFFEGENLEILHKIDEDWWMARNPVSECGMVPANYFNEPEQEIQETLQERFELVSKLSRLKFINYLFLIFVFFLYLILS